MKLRSLERTKKGWKITYIGNAPDRNNTPIKIEYPNGNDIDLGSPSRDFLQAIAKFLKIAIVIAQLNEDWWIKYGVIRSIRFKLLKDDTKLIKFTLEGDDLNLEKPLVLGVPYTNEMSIPSMLQAYDEKIPSYTQSVIELELEAEKYVSGMRFAEQTELPLQLEQVPAPVAS